MNDAIHTLSQLSDESKDRLTALLLSLLELQENPHTSTPPPDFREIAYLKEKE